ncbi:HAD family hydrolase [Vagococcus silagei]|uniref:HAD family phosphatase n=1 Tax=Vagococcus silagei TaxID=2508885 RepID=A0A4S3B8S7_9ENTE|nr:HAD family hydrolase [Vagococcus silagei]THB61355.1 HAD family phosphatase [Vagococcus silagei]
MIKRIFSDMDGTLLNKQGEISNANMNTIKTMPIPLTLVSGRAPIEMAPSIKRLGLTEDQIGFNGGLIYKVIDGGFELLHENYLELEVIETISRTIREKYPQVSLSVYDEANWFSDLKDRGIDLQHQATRCNVQLTSLAELFRAKKRKIFKMMLIVFDQKQLDEIHEYILSLGFDSIAVHRSGGIFLEVTSNQAQKALAIQKIMALENLKKEDIAAFGDGHNDISMLKLVGMPIVMGNAQDEIKEYALHITKSNLQDGVAYGIEKFCLPK